MDSISFVVARVLFGRVVNVSKSHLRVDRVLGVEFGGVALQGLSLRLFGMIPLLVWTRLLQQKTPSVGVHQAHWLLCTIIVCWSVLIVLLIADKRLRPAPGFRIVVVWFAAALTVLLLNQLEGLALLQSIRVVL